jgi:TIR domain
MRGFFSLFCVAERGPSAYSGIGKELRSFNSFKRGPVGRAIFISYRRDDTEGEAGRLFDDLVRTFGENSVFMDVAGINPGTDFRKAIDENVASCGVLLAMIGPEWATITNSSGQRRLDNENDYVRLEIASALARNVAVIPVLVHDSKMPHPEQLPENLKDLAYRNSVEITHARWNSDVQLLTKALSQYVTASSDTNTEPVHATVPVQLPPPNVPAAQASPVKASKMPLVAAISLAALILIATGTFFAFRNSGNPIDGTWRNPSPGGHNGLAKLAISGTGNQLSLHAWGECPDCDWGTQTATFDGQKATAVWSFKQPMGGEAEGRVATVTVAPGGNKLNVTIVNAFPNRAPNERRAEFVRP